MEDLTHESQHGEIYISSELCACLEHLCVDRVCKTLFRFPEYAVPEGTYSIWQVQVGRRREGQERRRGRGECCPCPERLGRGMMGCSDELGTDGSGLVVLVKACTLYSGRLPRVLSQ